MTPDLENSESPDRPTHLPPPAQWPPAPVSPETPTVPALPVMGLWKAVGGCVAVGIVTSSFATLGIWGESRMMRRITTHPNFMLIELTSIGLLLMAPLATGFVTSYLWRFGNMPRRVRITRLLSTSWLVCMAVFECVVMYNRVFAYATLSEVCLTQMYFAVLALIYALFSLIGLAIGRAVFRHGPKLSVTDTSPTTESLP